MRMGGIQTNNIHTNERILELYSDAMLNSWQRIVRSMPAVLARVLVHAVPRGAARWRRTAGARAENAARYFSCVELMKSHVRYYCSIRAFDFSASEFVREIATDHRRPPIARCSPVCS